MPEGSLKQRKIPQQARAATTVASILEAAARILEHEGIKGYNTNAVAKLAGFSVGSLYQYFPNKDAITRALIDQEAFSLLTALERIVEGSRGVIAIREIVTATVTHLMSRPNLARILDVQEQELGLQDDALRGETHVHVLIQRCLSDREYDGLSDKPMIAFDMIGIMRGIVDSAVARGERNIEQIVVRVNRAVEGYLALSREHR